MIESDIIFSNRIIVNSKFFTWEWNVPRCRILIMETLIFVSDLYLKMPCSDIFNYVSFNRKYIFSREFFWSDIYGICCYRYLVSFTGWVFRVFCAIALFNNEFYIFYGFIVVCFFYVIYASCWTKIVGFRCFIYCCRWCVGGKCIPNRDNMFRIYLKDVTVG